MRAAARTAPLFLLNAAVAIQQLATDEAAALDAFEDFRKSHGRTYAPGSAEYDRRFGHFRDIWRRVQAHNSKPDVDGRQDFVAGINYMADYTPAEHAGMRGYNRHARSSASSHASFLSMSSKVVEEAAPAPRQLPTNFSWGHLRSIKHSRSQGGCGSCWAIAAETVMRAHSEIYDKALNFSFTEMTACAPNPLKCGGDGGCRGSIPELAWEWVLSSGARLESQWHDGFTATNCPKFNGGSVVRLLHDGTEHHDDLGPNSPARAIGMVGYQRFPENKLAPMMRALVERGPLTISVAAGDFGIYDHGIMLMARRPEWTLDHGIVLYGYGEEHGQKYWQVKNSWGSHWGENGNARIERSDDEERRCGLDKDPLAGVECATSARKQVTVCGSFGILSGAGVPIFMDSRVALPGHRATATAPAAAHAAPAAAALAAPHAAAV